MRGYDKSVSLSPIDKKLKSFDKNALFKFTSPLFSVYEMDKR